MDMLTDVSRNRLVGVGLGTEAPGLEKVAARVIGVNLIRTRGGREDVTVVHA